jgi:predicted small secreted protein
MNCKDTFKRFIFIAFLFVSTTLAAQNTVVSGVVTDAGTKKPLSFVTVSFIGSTIGTNTNDDGQYLLRRQNPIRS